VVFEYANSIRETMGDLSVDDLEVKLADAKRVDEVEERLGIIKRELS
jgi:hypothetical protein